MLAHHKSWYRFVKGLGFPVRETDIILLSGWVKTSKWSISAFSTASKQQNVSISASYSGSMAANFSLSTENSASIPLEQRCNESRPTGIADPPKNQCMFIEYFKVQYPVNPFALGITLRPKAADARALADAPTEWRFGLGRLTRASNVCQVSFLGYS